MEVYTLRKVRTGRFFSEFTWAFSINIDDSFNFGDVPLVFSSILKATEFIKSIDSTDDIIDVVSFEIDLASITTEVTI